VAFEWQKRFINKMIYPIASDPRREDAARPADLPAAATFYEATNPDRILGGQIEL
jgi:hypothetical protein